MPGSPYAYGIQYICHSNILLIFYFSKSCPESQLYTVDLFYWWILWYSAFISGCRSRRSPGSTTSARTRSPRQLTPKSARSRSWWCGRRCGRANEDALSLIANVRSSRASSVSSNSAWSDELKRRFMFFFNFHVHWTYLYCIANLLLQWMKYNLMIMYTRIIK